MASNHFSARRGFRYSEGKTEGKAHLHGKELGNWNEGEKGKAFALALSRVAIRFQASALPPIWNVYLRRSLCW